MKSVPRAVATGLQFPRSRLWTSIETRSLPLLVLTSILITLVLLPCPSNYRGQAQNAKLLFPVEKDSKYGYIDGTGKIIIPIQFDNANEFHEGLALVITAGKKVFIDTNGRAVIAPDFDLVNDFSEGLAAVN